VRFGEKGCSSSQISTIIVCFVTTEFSYFNYGEAYKQIICIYSKKTQKHERAVKTKLVPRR
jgi:hypothetical protein